MKLSAPLSGMRLPAATIALAVPLVAAVVASCSSSSEEAAVSPEPPATIAFSLVGAATPSGDAGAFDEPVCVELGADGTVPVRVSLTNWLLRPPGACGVPQCGLLAVWVDPPSPPTRETSVVLTASPMAEIDFAKLAPSGVHTVMAALIDDVTRTIAVGADGKPLQVQVQVDVRAAGGCATQVDAGADAADAGADADAGDEDATTADAADEGDAPGDAAEEGDAATD